MDHPETAIHAMTLQAATWAHACGNILIDWTAEQPVIRLQVCDEKGGVVLQQRAMLSDLKAK